MKTLLTIFVVLLAFTGLADDTPKATPVSSKMTPAQKAKELERIIIVMQDAAMQSEVKVKHIQERADFLLSLKNDFSKVVDGQLMLLGTTTNAVVTAKSETIGVQNTVNTLDKENTSLKAKNKTLEERNKKLEHFAHIILGVVWVLAFASVFQLSGKFVPANPYAIWIRLALAAVVASAAASAFFHVLSNFAI